MRFHDLSCDKQTQARAALSLSREKWLENAPKVRRSNADSGIRYRDTHSTLGDSASDRKNTLIDVHHGIGGVLEKVDQRVNYLPAIQIDQAQTSIQMDLHVDKLSSQVRLDKPECIRNQFGKLARLSLRTSPAAKIEHAFR